MNLRHSIDVGRYQIHVFELGGEFVVEVCQHDGYRWHLVRGPFRRADLASAEQLAADLKESLTARVRMEER